MGLDINGARAAWSSAQTVGKTFNQWRAVADVSDDVANALLKELGYAQNATQAGTNTTATVAKSGPLRNFFGYFFKGGAGDVTGGVSQTGSGLLQTGGGLLRTAKGGGKIAAGTAIVGGTVVASSVIVDEVSDAVQGEDGNSGIPQPVQQAAGRMGQALQKATGIGQQPKPTEFSTQGALLFAGILGALGLTGAWLSGASVGMIALIGGGLAVAGAMGGGVLGGKAAEQAVAAVSTPGNTAKNTPSQEQSQQQSTYSSLGSLSAPATGPMPPKDPHVKTQPSTGVSAG